MKRIMCLLLMIVLCMLASTAMAGSEPGTSAVGFWTNEQRTELYAFKDDGTLLLCDTTIGRLTSVTWFQDEDLVAYENVALLYDAGADTLMSFRGSKMYTRLTDEEYAVLFAEATAAARPDAALEDFTGSWEYAGIYLAIENQTYSADEYDVDMHFTITDTTFSMPDGFFVSGLGGGVPCEKPCEMNGNALQIGSDYDLWFAVLSPDGVMSLKMSATSGMDCIFYLTRTAQN